MRAREAADQLEHRPVVLIVADADDATRLPLLEEPLERRSLRPIGGHHLDHTPAGLGDQIRGYEHRPEHRHQLVEGRVGVAVVHRRGARLHLQPHAVERAQQLGRLSVEAVQALPGLERKVTHSGIADEIGARKRHQALEIRGGPAAQDRDAAQAIDQALQPVKRSRHDQSLDRIGDDLGEGAVEVGNQHDPGGRQI